MHSPNLLTEADPLKAKRRSHPHPITPHTMRAQSHPPMLSHAGCDQHAAVLERPAVCLLRAVFCGSTPSLIIVNMWTCAGDVGDVARRRPRRAGAGWHQRRRLGALPSFLPSLLPLPLLMRDSVFAL